MLKLGNSDLIAVTLAFMSTRENEERSLRVLVPGVMHRLVTEVGSLNHGQKDA